MGGTVSSTTSPLVADPVASQPSVKGALHQQHIQQREDPLHGTALQLQPREKEQKQHLSVPERTLLAQQEEGLPMKLTKYDPTTYWGRVQAFQRRIDPRFVFVGEAEARRSQDIYTLAKRKCWTELRERGIDEQQLQNHVLVAQSTINTSDGSVIPSLLRLAAFAPVNIPITGGMLLSAPTFFNSVFWQWVNQTYNAAFNWANGNKAAGGASAPGARRSSAPFFSLLRYNKDTEDLLKGYAAAVFVSVGLAVGMNSMLLRSKLQGTVRRTLQAVVPYTAVASANFSNVLLMRGDELRKGIPVLNEDKERLGLSRAAGWSAVMQTAISRVATELAVIYGCLVGALPLAVGLFPEDGALPLHALEEDLQKSIKARKSGKQVETVYFNRGV